MNEDDAIDALLRGGIGQPPGKPPQRPERPRQSRVPAVLVSIIFAALLLTPLVLVLTADPTQLLLGLITGNPVSLFGGIF
ncbi:hypothetical protein [Cognatiyoonia sp. IB215182]|uniref:hypothetical protein n=1 Tax=Cognatiyoonia sp. IB215182 TaxID=3097353 RepID=UPI002A0E4B90|nr:hypothetical protein [Cognatiyoonia sp. IB215182]MDX8352378.1 hypothetical protein [Cognatiyoonia sp. IB215182]